MEHSGTDRKPPGDVRPKTVLVIEDDATIARAVEARLLAEGYDVVVAFDGPSGVQAAETCRADLVVLDVMLPGYDGYEVCRRVQRARPVPVIMLTARSDEADTLVGLAVGADDYLTKPFSPRELVARIAALLRRVERARELAQQPGPDAGATVTLGDVSLDVAARRVSCRGDEVHLTPTEFDILTTFVDHPRTVLTRDQLVAQVRDWVEPAGTRLVDSHIKALRRKLGHDVIRTVHGVGYALGRET